MFRTVFGVAVVTAALVALAGCRAQETEKPEQREAARKAANYNPFRDPAVREALLSDQVARDKFLGELDEHALPGKAPGTGAVEAPPATPAGETPPAGGETTPAAGETTPAAGEADKPATGEGEAGEETPAE